MKILVIGVDTDSTVVHFLAQCARKGMIFEAINLREVAASGAWSFAIPEDGSSFIEVNGRIIRMAEFGAIYSRPIDLTMMQHEWRLRARYYGLMAGLRAWLETRPGLVVNRPNAGRHNASKALHELLLGVEGLRVPESLTSSNVEELRSFASDGRTIAKTLSGVRANAREIAVEDFIGFEPDQGPVHLQRLIAGIDLRTHVVGLKAISVGIYSDAVDYRKRGTAKELKLVRLDSEIEQKLIDVTASLGLTFAGWDLKVDEEEVVWVLEANPMPGYSFYDKCVDGAITRSLVDALRAGVQPMEGDLIDS